MTADLKPGRELDALVAEKVMGWRRMTYAEQHAKREPGHGWANDHRLTMYWHSDKLTKWGEHEEVRRAEPSDCIDCGTEFPAFSPSTSIADAWLVVEKMIECGIGVAVTNYIPSEYRWECSFDTTALGNDHVGVSDTAPHAICLAALKALNAL